MRAMPKRNLSLGKVRVVSRARDMKGVKQIKPVIGKWVKF
jgi:hypothetical protein